MLTRTILRTLVTAGLCAALASPACADEQSDRLQALEKSLAASTDLIAKLSARLAELERSVKVAGAAPAAAASAATAGEAPANTAQAIAALQDSVAQISDSIAHQTTDTGLPLHGFANTGAGWSAGSDPLKLRGFNGGQVDLYLTPQISPRVRALAEIVLEYNSMSGQMGIDTERLQVGYTVNDGMTLWLGRFHTPLGLWNTSFHHGANLQTSIYRPRFVDFEDSGGIIPAHTVGLWATGKVAEGAGRLTYDAYVGNEHRIIGQQLDFSGYTDDSHGKMLGANVGYQFAGALSGLTLGVHGYGTTVKAYDLNDQFLNATKQLMTGGYVGYDENDWEIIGEYYHFDDTDVAGGPNRTSNLEFLQVGRTFVGFTPYLRAEKAGLDPLDNYFRSQETGRSYRREVLGVRYALDARSSIKFELSSTQESGNTLLDGTGSPYALTAVNYRRGSLQFAVAF